MVELLLVAFFLALVVGHWADSWGRDRLEWTILSCFLSPLVGGVHRVDDLGAGDDGLQLSACTELGNRGLLGLGALTRSGVAHHASRTDSPLEGTEAGDRDLLPLGHFTGDRVEHGLEGV